MKRILFMSLAVVMALSVSLIGCDGDGGAAIPYENDGMFVQQTIGEIDSLDPAWGYDTASGEQVQYIYETLLYYDGEAVDEFIPALATEWTVVNATQIKFLIRPGVNFHEGGNLTAEDVEYSFERSIVQDRGGGPTWMLNYPLLGKYRTRVGAVIVVTGEEIDNAVEVDGDWVVFNMALEFPMLQWMQILTQCWGSIVDKEWCVDNGEWDGDLTGEGWKDYNNPAKQDSYLYNLTNGTGRWKLNLWDPGTQIKLEKNTGYWGGSVPFDWVITVWDDEWTNRKLALLNGDADHIYVPRMYIGELEGIADLTVYQDLPQLAVDSFFFNFSIDPDSDYIGSGAHDGAGIPPDFFTDLNVRLAFCNAFDYATFLEDAFLNEAKQMGGPIVEGLLGYNPNDAKHSQNVTAVKTYLEAAWNNTWETGFQLILTYNSGNDVRKTGCDILAEFFADLGDEYFEDSTHFSIAVQPVSWPTFLDLIFSEDPGVHKGPLPMFMIGWLADYPDPDNFATPFMHSYGDWAYYQGYSDSHVDEIIETARFSTDDEEREDIYYELQQIYYDDAPGIMMFQPLGRRYFTKYVTGFYFNPTIPGQPGPLWDMSKSES